MGGSSVRMAFRLKIFTENPYCHWCDKRMILNPEPDEVEEMATIEHLIPKSEGGTDEESNLRLCHKKCNK